ncbi:MAG: hypothetical protein ACXVCO_14230 [Ktedonobacterales bacterium]
MKMGRERDILRWDIHTSLLRERIARVEEAIADMLIDGEAALSQRDRERVGRLNRELADLRHRLSALGPSPRAKMG